MEKQGDVYIIPSSEVGGFDAITRSAAELLTKLNRIEYDKICRSIENAVVGLDTTINGAQTKRTLAALEKAMIDVQDIAKKLDTEGTPALKRLPAIAQQLQEFDPTSAIACLVRSTRAMAVIYASAATSTARCCSDHSTRRCSIPAL